MLNLRPNYLKVCTTKPVWLFRKQRNEHSLSRKGRWGPAWLHKLVFRVASNLGMVSHPVGETFETVTIPIDASLPVYQQMLKSIEHRLGYYLENRSQIEIVCGPDVFDEMCLGLGALRYQVPFELRTTVGTKHSHTIMGVPIRIIPGLSGFAVLPLAKEPQETTYRPGNRSSIAPHVVERIG